ncbi:MAG: NAD(+) synthase [Myxococcota bacterium]
MKLIKVGVSAVNQLPFDWRGNASRLLQQIHAAKQAKVTVLCLPELAVTGYNCEDLFSAPELQRRAFLMLRDELAPETEGMIVSVGLPVQHLGALYNTAALIVDRRIIGFTAKQFLAGDGIHYEPRWFKPWPVGEVAEVELEGERYPMGDLHYDVGGVRFGFEVCEDAWVADRPGTRLALRGVDVFLNPSASHFAFDKQSVRRRFVLEGSRAFGAAYLYANLLGNEAGRAIYDGGTLIAETGETIAEGPRFKFGDGWLTTAVIDIDHTRSIRARRPSFQPAVEAEANTCVKAPFDYPDARYEPPVGERAEWEESPRLKEEEFTRALALGLFDYLRKSRSRGYVVSLSGGADSAAVAVLVSLMLRHAAIDLGPDGVRKRLAYLALAEKPEEWVEALLTTAYQATANSSEVTQDAARAVAEAVGARHHELDVDGLVTGYRERIEEAFGRSLSWETDDITLQNIQARVRAPSIWMLANLKNAVLLATSNRSEAAVGYATMDGDTAGGLSPIAGIDKAFLRRWLRWMEEEGPMGLGPIPVLAKVNVQAPTAELRPQEAAQTDEADLMPYPMLDAIEELAIGDKRSPIECFRVLSETQPELDRATLREWIRRFFVLWCRNQWKRERYAPSFHLDDKNLDPKTWCRFPILNGGFQQELEELMALPLREESKA